MTYLVGSTALLLDVPQYTIVPANADISLDYTLGATTPPFITVVQPTSGVFQVTVYTTNTADTGVYPLILTFHEYFSGLTRSTTFTVTVSCV